MVIGLVNIFFIGFLVKDWVILNFWIVIVWGW